LIPRKINKIVAYRFHILKLICIKFDFGWGSAPDPTGGAYSALPRPPSFKRAYFKGKGKGRTGRNGKGRGEGRGGDLPLRQEDRGREGREERGGGGLAPQTRNQTSPMSLQIDID